MSIELQPCPIPECGFFEHHYHDGDDGHATTLANHRPGGGVDEHCLDEPKCYTTALPVADTLPSTLHTVDCHGIDPAVVQEWLSARVGEARARGDQAKAEAATRSSRDRFQRATRSLNITINKVAGA